MLFFIIIINILIPFKHGQEEFVGRVGYIDPNPPVMPSVLQNIFLYHNKLSFLLQCLQIYGLSWLVIVAVIVILKVCSATKLLVLLPLS